LYIYRGKNEHEFIPHKINTKLIISLNVKAETIKLEEGHISGKSSQLELD
jgi:hypothetical protein